jgi:hypothetical protein
MISKYTEKPAQYADILAEGICILGHELNVLWANEVLRSMVAEGTEIEGISFFDIFHCADKSLLYGVVSGTVPEINNEEIYLKNTRNDGDIGTFTFSCKPVIRKGELNSAIAIIRAGPVLAHKKGRAQIHYGLKRLDIGMVLSECIRLALSTPDKEIIVNHMPRPGIQITAGESIKDAISNIMGQSISNGKKTITINVRVEQEPDTGNHILMIEDNGPGISDHDKALLKGVFGAHIDKSLERIYSAKSILLSFGCRMCVEDRVTGDRSKGSRYIVYIPASHS